MDSEYFERVSCAMVLACLFICYILYKVFTTRKFKLPPGPTGLPLLGYLPFLGNNPPLTLQKLSEKYGTIFGLYLGRSYYVVVTDFVVAKQLLSKASVAYRPDGLFAVMPGGFGLVEKDGPEWVEQRRYTVAEMKNLGLGRSHWENLIEMEVQDFVEILARSKGQPVNIRKELSASISNNILTLVTSNRLPVNHPKRDIIDQGIASFQVITDQSGLISSYPRLFKILVQLGIIEGKQKLNDLSKTYECIRSEIEETRKNKDDVSYINKYFSEIEKNRELNLRNSFNEANLLGNVQALIFAGSDTTKVSLFWLFLAMASFPGVQNKVQEEVDKVIGKDGSVDWADRNKLPYSYATILEGQRWRTVVPLNVVHRTAEDIEVNGYEIPKGTNIFAMISSFHKDTKYWKDPEKFQPERFLSEDGTFQKEPEGFMPFSSGKRVCIGKTVALIEIFYYFITIMRKFQILPASTTLPDLEGIPGITLQPKYQPLRFVAR